MSEKTGTRRPKATKGKLDVLKQRLTKRLAPLNTFVVKSQHGPEPT